MNNIEELKAAATAMRLSSTMRITDEIITFRRLFTPDCILNLIAQLEAAQKENANDNKLKYIRRLEAEKQTEASTINLQRRMNLELMTENAGLKDRVEKAEAALSAANEKLSKAVVLPDDGLEDCINMWPDNWRNDFDTGYNFGIWRCEQNIKTAGFAVEGE